MGPLTPGSSSSLSNSQCTLNGVGSSASVGVGSSASGSGVGPSISTIGTTLTLTLSVTATVSFIGTKNVYLLAEDSEGSISGWDNAGTWTPTADTPPSVGTLTSNPSPATATNEVFTATFVSNNGKSATDLTWAYFVADANNAANPPNDVNACFVRYYQPTNSLYLQMDSGSGVLGPLTPGSANSLTNTQCTLYGTGSSATVNGSDLTLQLSVSANAGFAGSSHEIYLLTIDSEGSNSGYSIGGGWTPPPIATTIRPH